MVVADFRFLSLFLTSADTNSSLVDLILFILFQNVKRDLNRYIELQKISELLIVKYPFYMWDVVICTIQAKLGQVFEAQIWIILNVSGSSGRTLPVPLSHTDSACASIKSVILRNLQCNGGPAGCSLFKLCHIAALPRSGRSVLASEV